MNNNSFFKNLKFDIPAGLVVFLVALPLCLGIALASGAPMFAGIIAGIVGGIVVGAISGSPLGVSGPAAGLAVIVADSIKELGTNANGEFDMMEGFQAFLVAGVIAGIIQIILGAVRAGIIGYYFPTSVIQGMLAGIGITLILKQIPHALGWDKNPEGEWEFFQTDGHNSFSEIGYALENFTMGAVIVTVIALGILILFQQSFMKKSKIMSLIPGPLIAVISGIVINEVLKSYFPDLALVNEQEFIDGESLQNNHMVNIKAADVDKPYYGLLTFPDWSILKNPSIYLIGFTMAVVASLETLLCVEATDKLDPQKRTTPTNRELFAQGTGNVVSSLIGGLPITQVIVRSSANIDSGGKTKISAISHGFFLAAFVLLLPWLLNMIPLSCLAAILLLVGYKLAKVELFKKMYKNGLSQFIPFIVTILVIVFANLLWGIIAGLVVSTFYILKQSYKNALYSKFIQKEEGTRNKTIIQLGEVVSFFNKGHLHKRLSELENGCFVVIDGTKNKHMDYDIFDLFEDFMVNAQSRNIKVEYIGFDTGRSEKLSNFVKAMKENYDNVKDIDIN
jgi:MFS superfamily sulfate permease-like transporter